MTLPANPSPAQEMDFFTDRGYSVAEHLALLVIWGHDRNKVFLSENSLELRDRGYAPAPVLDAEDHFLDWQAAEFYYAHGLSAHEAYLVRTQTKAVTNLQHQPPIGRSSLFSVLPAKFAFQIAFLAEDSADLASLKLRYEHAAAGTPVPGTSSIEILDEVVDGIAMLFALLTPPNAPCCGHGWN